MKILILGATGNLNRLATALLAGRNPDTQLRLASHREEGRASLRETFPGADVVDADWYQPSSLGAAFQGIDKALMVTPDFLTDEQQATRNVIDAIRSVGGIRQLVRFIAIPPGFVAADLTPEQLATRCGAALHCVAKRMLDASGLPVTYVNAASWIMFNLPWFMASEVKSSRRLIMPSQADAPRQWLSENDIAEVFAKILTDPAARHIGREYLLTGHGRFTFPEVAALIGEVLGEPVTYVDDASELRKSMGDLFPALMTYFTHETLAYRRVPETHTIEELLGHPQITLRQYIEQNRGLFA
jgi:uncharacterized protein YbjT (DUF2867 family)